MGKAPDAMKFVALATALLVAKQAMPAPALEGSDVTLLGQWQYSYLSNATYSGRITVDARGQANLTARAYSDLKESGGDSRRA